MERIDDWGQLNIHADTLAKHCLHHIINTGERLVTYPSLQNTIPTIYYNNFSNHRYSDTTIYSHAAKTLKHLIARDRGIAYWKKHHNRNIQHRYIDQDSFFHASNNVSSWQRRCLTKWSCGMCGVGKWLLRWKEQPHSRCPRCQTTNETVAHVVHCQHEDASLLWTTGVSDIRD